MENRTMKTDTRRSFWRARWLVAIAMAAGTVAVIAPPRSSVAAGSSPKTFASASEAAAALAQAVRGGDDGELQAILGAGKHLTSCGEKTTDARERDRFVQKYQQMHRLVVEPDGTTVLYVGAENWPFPVPLVSSQGRWHFDGQAGLREVTFRRIGANEATALEVCRAAVDATKGRGASESDDPVVRYGTALVGDGGAEPGDAPFHGYRFAVQRTKAGGKDAGLTVIAYPAEYRTSGVMTFIVGEDGVVYERDLGPDTARAARRLKHRPAWGWRAVG